MDRKTNQKKITCCLCKIQFKGYGNNPDPIKKEGKCCDQCNIDQVIPARLELTKIMMQYGTNERNLSGNDK